MRILSKFVILPVLKDMASRKYYKGRIVIVKEPRSGAYTINDCSKFQSMTSCFESFEASKIVLWRTMTSNLPIARNWLI